MPKAPEGKISIVEKAEPTPTATPKK